MISTILTGHKANMLGSIWMIASMAIFAIEDAFVKAASNALPVGWCGDVCQYGPLK